MIQTVGPKPWNSAHDPAGIWYEFDFEQTVLSSVSNSGGFAQFNLGALFSYPPTVGDRLYVVAGSYQGYHTITSVLSSAQFVTSTAYTGTQSGGIKFIRTPQVEIWVGYKAGEGYDVQLPLTKVGTITPEVWPDVTMKINVAAFIRSSFLIQKPTIGIDFSLFNRFRLYFDGAYDQHYQVLNSAITHGELSSYVATGDYLNTTNPATMWGCGDTLLTYIGDNVVYVNSHEDAQVLPGYSDADYDPADYIT